MALSSSRILLALGLCLAGVSNGCLTGHTLDGARLDETPETILLACRRGEWLDVRYRAVSTREFGEVASRDLRAAAIRIAHLEAWPRVRVDTIEVIRLDPKEVTNGKNCTAVPAQLGLPRAPRPGAPLTIPHGALHRDRTAAWAYPLVPLAVAADALFTPVLAAFWMPYTAMSD